VLPRAVQSRSGVSPRAVRVVLCCPVRSRSVARRVARSWAVAADLGESRAKTCKPMALPLYNAPMRERFRRIAEPYVWDGEDSCPRITPERALPGTRPEAQPDGRCR
jgi:hypothetical protein